MDQNYGVHALVKKELNVPCFNCHLSVATVSSYEKRKARERRGKHLGGPDEPDYVRGETEGEVKDWNRPMGKTDVMKEAEKGRTEIVSKKGFTDEAITYAKRYRPELRLIHGKKVVKPRRRKK